MANEKATIRTVLWTSDVTLSDDNDDDTKV